MEAFTQRLAVATAIAALLFGPAAGGQEAPAGLPEGIAACAAIEDVTLRLACFDREVAVLEAEAESPAAETGPPDPPAPVSPASTVSESMRQPATRVAAEAKSTPVAAPAPQAVPAAPKRAAPHPVAASAPQTTPPSAQPAAIVADEFIAKVVEIRRRPQTRRE